MLHITRSSECDPYREDVDAYRAALEAWLATRPPVFEAAARPIASYEQRVAVSCALMQVLFDQDWARYGWPEHLGGLGGDIRHRAAMWEALARHGLPAMALFEHLEILAPTLVALGDPGLMGQLLPRFLRGEQLWSQGFSEPEAGSDLASARTRAVAVDGGHVITGRKIWTSWARYARWCLVLARTGTPQERHRGLSAFVVDLEHPGVEVRPIEQANGTDELAEVTFDEVPVGPERLVGELGGGWRVAMHILAHERGTFGWYRHSFLNRQLLENRDQGTSAGDALLGNALLDLAAVRAASGAAVRAHAAGGTLGPRAAFVKLMLAASEQAVNDWTLASVPDLAVAPNDDHMAVCRQDYLFSRIVTVYGGSQQMQLDTIAKQILRLP
ncbi:acyl-CoA dehydrogenase [Frankia sp. CcI49]|uniref:acyl-CoA dehydrogenase family protein n=1 Tax=unclassified Frankia TaxID=2632575 RepID=UPI0006CA42F4|nr:MULTISPECIES: acyl-CoA dehydrogenase family protein [unclassified Frankia]ONH58164.1 acyl-CoA dehydrogenase [Frankia sp. CcI49]